MKLPATIISATLFLAVTSSANLIISVDHINNTLTMNGTISGTTDASGDIQFRAGPDDLFGASTSMFITSGITGNPFGVSNAYINIETFAGDDGLEVVFSFNPTNGNKDVSLEGNGNLINYELNSTFEPILKDLAAANTVLPLTSGTTTDTLTLVAVPEPAAYAPLLGLCCAVLVLCRRRCR